MKIELHLIITPNPSVKVTIEMLADLQCRMFAYAANLTVEEFGKVTCAMLVDGEIVGVL